MKLNKKHREWQKGVRKTYEEIRKEKELCSIKLARMELDIFPNVFSPAYFPESEWFALEISKIVNEHANEFGPRSLLEIGTGTGIIALRAALDGSLVSATDINPDAVKNAKHNFKKHQVDVKTYCGSVYDPLPLSKSYDYIVWNHPFNRGVNPNEEMLLKAGFDYKYEDITTYFEDAGLYLTNPNYGLMLATSNFVSTKHLERIIANSGFKRVHRIVKHEEASTCNAIINELYVDIFER